MFSSASDYHCIMRKFTDEQVKQMQVVMQAEYEEKITIEDAAMAMHNLHELYDVLCEVARKTVQ